MLIESLVFPHIRYCITVWGNCTATQKQRVQKAANFGVRIVTGLGRREHVKPSLRELGWPTMDFKPSVSVLFGHYSLPW